MAHIGPVCRWEIYRVDFEPTVGSEQAGENRPALVISNDEANRAFGVVAVVPLTKLEGKARKPHAFELQLPKGCVNNEFTPFALPHQIKTVAKQRLLERVGKLEGALHRERVEDALLTHLGIDLDCD